MEYLFIYLFSIIDDVKNSMCGLCALTLFVTCFAVAIYASLTDCFSLCKKENVKKLIKWLKISGISMCIMIVFNLLLPSSKTLAMMGGVYYGKKLSTSLELNDKVQKVSELIDLKLDGCIKEAKNDR